MKFKQFANLSLTLLGIGALFFASSAYALEYTPNGTPDAVTMLVNLSKAMPSLMQLITALAYVMGFFFVIKGVIELKQFGESRSMMSREHHLAGPLMYIVVGTMLIYLPATVHIGFNTFWESTTPYAYQTDTPDSWSEFTNAIFMLIQLVGTISLIRGLVFLTHLGGGHGQQGTFGKAMAHIIAGILCINLYGFLQTIFSTLGLGQLS